MRRERPRVGRTSRPRELCTTIPDDRGDESFADDLNMGRGIVSGRVALLLRSTEIPPHRPKDFPTPPHSRIPLPCLALPPKTKYFGPVRIFSPAKKFGPCGRQRRARGPGSESKEGEREGRKEGKTLGRKTHPNSSSSPKSFPPLTGCKLGPGAQPPGPRRAFYRNFRRGIFPPLQSRPP